MLNLKKSAILSLFLITGCSPHPGAGMWVSSAGNEANITKMSVYFEPKVEIYYADSNEPAMQCGWWALDRKNIEMECVHLSDTEQKEKFQLNVTGIDEAELLQEERLITRLVRQRD
ncbi:hypothetical protein ACFL3P_02905 [Pseudomonadota bacterium]